MNTYAYLVLAIAALASSQAKEDLQVCWRDTYCRDYGSYPNYCNETFELQGHRCYPQCKENYTGEGSHCWEKCPEGYTDIGDRCVFKAEVYWPCPWYDICGLITPGCIGNCSEGYEEHKCACRGKIIPKKSYYRGCGEEPSCPPEKEASLGLCYEPCKSDYTGLGSICWTKDSGNATYEVECNPLAFGHNETDCAALNKLLQKAGFDNPECIGSLAASIKKGHVFCPQYCYHSIKKALPKLRNTPAC